MDMSVQQRGIGALSLARGGGSQFLERLLLLSTDHMGADGAVLISRADHKCDILCSVGLPLSATVQIDDSQFNQFLKQDGNVNEGSRRETAIRNWPFIQSAPYWKSFRVVKLDVQLPSVDVIAVVGSYQDSAPRSMREARPSFGRLIEVFQDVFSMIVEIADLSNRQVPLVAENILRENCHPTLDDLQLHCENHNVVERFLMDTLISQPRVLSRGSVSYHGIRRWRQNVRSEQIAGLKAIKRMPSSHFEFTIAEEMSSWCRRAFGGTAFANVVAVPCGHSGTECLARRIGQQVAIQLGITYTDAFMQLDVKGSSHPKTNMQRPKMKLTHVPVGPILLVDDVATSGSHISEATVALRNEGLAVSSVAWIASS